jgi:hypothetical protein
MNRAVVTIVTRNYLAYARVLMRQCRRHDPAVDRFVVVIDRPPDGTSADVADAEVIYGDELGVENWPRYAFQYTPFELSCALKPFAVDRLFAKHGYDAIVYLDGDMGLYRPLDPAWQALESCSVALTAHLLRPLPDDGLRPHESVFSHVGAYNAGFVGVRNDAAGRGFVTWWRSMLAKHCIVDLAAGYFVDQRWLCLAPGLFPGVHVLRHFGVNAGHWTLSQAAFRPQTPEDPSRPDVYVDDDPLVLFHFSGMTPLKPADYLANQNRTSLARIPCLERLVEHYHRDLAAAGLADCAAWGCGMERLRDGTPVDRTWREAIRREEPDFADVADPFDTDARPDLVARFRKIEVRGQMWRRDWQVAALKGRGVTGKVRLAAHRVRDTTRAIRAFFRAA